MFRQPLTLVYLDLDNFKQINDRLRHREGDHVLPLLAATIGNVVRAGIDQGFRLLLAWGLVPLAFMPLVGMLVGADLQLHWGTPFLLFFVPAAMELLPRVAWQRANLTKVLVAFVLVQGLLLAISHLTSPLGPAALRDRHWRAFDAADLAERIARPERLALGGPIRVVSGDAARAGALALRLREHPLVLIDGRLDQSPWVEVDLVRRCGVVRLGPTQSLPGGTSLGPSFPGLAWRVVRRDAAAAACRA